MPRKKTRRNNDASSTVSKTKKIDTSQAVNATGSKNDVKKPIIVLSDNELTSGAAGGAIKKTNAKSSNSLQEPLSNNNHVQSPWMLSSLMNMKTGIAPPDLKRFGEDIKLVHILYSQLRIINLFQLSKIPKMRTADFVSKFWQLYHEDFFRFEVLKNFVLNADPTTVVQQFIAIHCSHFLVNMDLTTISVKGDLNQVSNSLFQNFCDLFDKVLHPKPTTKELDPTPSEISLIGNYKEIDVHGKRHSLKFDIQGGGRQQASLKEVGQRINLIRKNISRRGDSVTFANVSYELCKYYNVRCVNDLYLKNSNGRPITLERDIQEINNIIRLQAKVCFFDKIVQYTFLLHLIFKIHFHYKRFSNQTEIVYLLQFL